MAGGVWKKGGRVRPFFCPYSLASAFMCASTFFCRSVCAIGRYSSLETRRVGIGVPPSTSCAGTRSASSLSLSMPIIVLHLSTEARHHLGPELLDRPHQDGMRHQAVVSVAEHPIDGLPLLLGLHCAQHRIGRADIGVAHGDHFL